MTQQPSVIQPFAWLSCLWFFFKLMICEFLLEINNVPIIYLMMIFKFQDWKKIYLRCVNASNTKDNVTSKFSILKHVWIHVDECNPDVACVYLLNSAAILDKCCQGFRSLDHYDSNQNNVYAAWANRDIKAWKMPPAAWKQCFWFN